MRLLAFDICQICPGAIMSVLRRLSSLFWVGLLSPFGSPLLGPVLELTPSSLELCHVLPSRPTGVGPPTITLVHLLTQFASSFLFTWPNHLSLCLLKTVPIPSTPTLLLSSSRNSLSTTDTPHIHLIILILISQTVKTSLKDTGHYW